MDIQAYLDRYAEKDVQIAAHWKGPRTDVAVVVPTLGEGNLASELWPSLARAARFSGVKALAIAVVNATDQHPEWVHEANQATLAELGKNSDKQAWLTPFSDDLTILVVDRASPPLRMQEREGVGHARKIGSDIAVALYQQGSLTSDYISTTDADARVDERYFDWHEGTHTMGLGTETDAAVLHPFRHEVEDGQSLALLLYEISLRYYVLGLEYAGSPYAFHTIGSTLTFRAGAYAGVRGFPKREAAEDFYLLDKLAKIGKIRRGGGEIKLLARPSNRVPFGTGRSMQTITEKLERGEPFCLYHPQGFHWLRVWLNAARAFAEHRDLSRTQREISDPLVLKILESQGAWECLAAGSRQRKQASDLCRHVLTWFDGLKTLKFIHALRDSGLGLLEYRTALRSAPFLEEANHEDSAEAWLERMRRRDSF